MGETPLSLFINLITFDRETERIQTMLEAIEQERRSLKQQERTLSDQLTNAQTKVASAKKEVHLHESLIKEYDQKIQKKKDQLASAASPKEHRALTQEIAALNAQQLEEEEMLLAAWAAFEQAQRLHQETVVKTEMQRQELEKAFTTQEQEQHTYKNQIHDRLALRTEQEHGVPEEWLEKYNAMRSRVHNPVVPAEQESCSACFYSIPGPDMVLLRRRALLQCKSCYRFLYLPSAYTML